MYKRLRYRTVLNSPGRFDVVRISRNDLEMPEYIFETEGLWIMIDKEIESQIEAKGFDLAGTLHAVEHTTIACILLLALRDRGDIGGLSYKFYPVFKWPAIFMMHFVSIRLSQHVIIFL